MDHTSTLESGCLFPGHDPIYKAYHDSEWGLPVADNTRIFEKICLEGFQSGLSWKTILHRRDAFRTAFDEFDIDKVAQYSDIDIRRLLRDCGIIRNRRKILSAINNANRALELTAEYGSIATFLWRYEASDAQRPEVVTRSWLAENTTSVESIALSKSLKQRGWSFIGPTNMYALIQALGLVNDHTDDCPARTGVEESRSRFRRP